MREVKGSLPSGRVKGLATLLALALASPLWAQEGTAPAPGARIRVTLEGEEARSRIGRYEAVRDTALVLRSGDSAQLIPMSRVRRLEVSRGRKPSTVGGAIGAVLGGLSGAFAAGCLANRDDYGVLCGGQDDTKLVDGGLVGGAVGATVGALLGRRDRWQALEPGWRDPPPPP